MKIIDEIHRQRAILGLAQAERIILSHSAFQHLLAEGDVVCTSSTHRRYLQPFTG